MNQFKRGVLVGASLVMLAQMCLLQPAFVRRFLLTEEGLQAAHFGGDAATDDADRTKTVTTTTKNYNGFAYPDRLYGHIHMPKTAGSTLNGEMAARFERVCGNKGYSYDFYNNNNRTSANGEQPVDSYTKLARGFNRGEVPPNLMNEIGYHGTCLCVPTAGAFSVFL